MDKKLFNFIKTAAEDGNSIKRNTKYYLSIFKQNTIGQWFPSWNWACFFTSFIGLEFAWLFYRRMYFNGILIGLFGVVSFEFIRVKIGLLFVTSFGFIFGKAVMWLFKLLWVFVFTLYGNALYGKHIDQQLKKGKAESGTDPYTPTIIIFLVYTIGTYAIMKLMNGNVNEAGVQQLMEKLVNKNAG